jgi:hypothetical protein
VREGLAAAVATAAGPEDADCTLTATARSRLVVSMPSLDDPLASQIEARFNDAVRFIEEPPAEPI